MRRPAITVDSRSLNSNYWTANSAILADAYARNAGTLRFHLVTKLLLSLISAPEARIIDVGGGYGLQAVMLARAGHSVTVLDVDPGMLKRAEELAAGEPQSVQHRLQFVLCSGQSAVSLVGTGFDVVCCHSVLMYERDPKPLLIELTRLARAGGLLSVLSLNPRSNAMRSGLQGRWAEAAATLQSGTQMDDLYVQCAEHDLDLVTNILQMLDVNILGWQGIGIFTDHHIEAIEVSSLADVMLAEWLAGHRDPYRQVARCYHLLGATKAGHAKT